MTDNLYRRQKADIIFPQETHSTEETEVQWKREWGAICFALMGQAMLKGLQF